MDCATTNGSGSRICCQGGSGMLASPLKTTADSSKRSSIATVPEFRGVTFRNALGTGKTFTDGSAAGRRPGCGNGCLSTSPARPTTNTPCSTARLCGRTSTAPALPKKDEDQAIGKSRGGLSTKIHALVDALGNPLAFLLTPGQTHDLVGADARLPQMAADTLIADKAGACPRARRRRDPGDADARVRQPLTAAAKSAVIPPRPNRLTPPDFDRDLYKARHLIENFFCKLKQFRAIATLYDKTARNFLAAI